MNRVVVPDLKAKKRRGERIAMLTAYDATMARLLDRTDLGNVIHQLPSSTTLTGHHYDRISCSAN